MYFDLDEDKDPALHVDRPFVGPPRPTELAAGTVTPAAPAASPALAAPAPVTAADLDRAAADKRQMALLGAIGENLANRQSFGNFFTGKMAPHQDMSGFTKTMMDAADEPLQRRKILYDQYQEQKAAKKSADEEDANSERSKQFRTMIAQRIPGMAKAVEGMSVSQLREAAPFLMKKLEGEYDLQKEQLKIDAERAKKDPTNMTPEQRLAKLSGEEKKRVDSILMGLKGIRTMRAALGAGQSTFHPIGDNDFSLAASNYSDAIGRLQSGGAINKDEEKRFRGWAPGSLDNDKIRAQKLANAESEFLSRLKNAGFQEQDFPMLSQIQLADPGKGAGQSRLINDAQAGQPEMMEAMGKVWQKVGGKWKAL